MPWISSRELRRIERERAEAATRAVSAELRLDKEREAKDRLIVQLTSRVLIKNGAYSIEPPPPLPPPDPRGFAREPSDEDLARHEYYKKCYADAGRTEEEATQLWEAEMRGEQVTYEYQTEQ